MSLQDTQKSETSPTAKVNLLINEAIKALGTNSVEHANTLIIEAKELNTPVKDLEFVHAMCLIKLRQLDRARVALEAELKNFPDNKEAAGILEALVQDMRRGPTGIPTPPIGSTSAIPLVGASSVAPWTQLKSSAPELKLSASTKIKVLLVYSIHPQFGKITLPEWIKESIREYFAGEVEVFCAGPNNEINVSDGVDFYKRIAQVVDKYKIDLLWDIEGGAESLDFVFRRFPDEIKIPKFFWAIDTHQYLDLQIEKAKHFDIAFSAQKNGAAKFGANGRWLPAGASLYEVDHDRARTIDLGFVGNVVPGLHNERQAVITRLKNEFPEFQVFKDVFLHEKAVLVSKMKILVNVSLNKDINFRVFETLACGAMLLTDDIKNNGLEDMFVDGKHLVTYSSPEDLIEKARYYLAHPAEREKIAKAGQELVRSKFMHRHLIKQVLDQFRDLRAGGAKPTVASERKCWCGGTLENSSHKLYGSCTKCKTQVLRKNYSAEELKKFYSMEGYWHERQMQVFNFPPIEERANNDFKDRIPVWHQVLAKYKPTPEHLLEIGCAHGGFLYYCRERGAKNVVGVEVDEKTCKFARERFGIAHVMSGLFPEVKLPFEKFDAITGFDVIEHFIDPIGGLSAVANMLKDDGICFFQTPWYRGEGETWNQFKPAEHTFLYSTEGIKELFERVGLEVIEILQGYFPDDMFIIGRKKK